MRIILSALFFVLTLSGYSQFPVNQFLGSSKTNVISRGVFTSDSGYITPNFSDTSTASLGYLKNISGLVIRANDTLYYRNQAATQWVKVGSQGGTCDSCITDISYRAGTVLDTLFYTNAAGNTDFYTVVVRDGLISGGIVTYTGLAPRQYFVTGAVYRKNGVFYTTTDTTITLSAPNPDSSRTDVFVVNTNSQTTTITGVESANPLTPQINSETDVFLTSVTITPLSPSGLDTVVIYDQNVEWNKSAIGVSVNFANTINPWRGSIAADVGAINNNDVIGFGDPLNTQYNRNSYAGISMFIRLRNVVPNNNNIFISFFNGSSAVSNEVALPINKSNISSYQGISVNMNSFTWFNQFFDSVRIRYAGSGIAQGFLLDLVYLENGISGNPSQSNFVQNIRRQGNNVDQQVNGVWTTQFSIGDKVDTSRTITAGYGLSGGGSLGSNRTISADTTVLSSKTFVTNTLGNYVDRTTDQTVAGEKTFTDTLFSTKEIVIDNGMGTIEVGHELLEATSTGLISGGALSVGSPTSTYTIAAGTGHVANNVTNRYNGVEWNTSANRTPSLATALVHILVDSTGAFVEQSTFPTRAQRRSFIYLGYIAQQSGVIVGATASSQVVAQPINQSYDFFDAYGPFNVSGNVLSAAGSNMQVNRTSGSIFKAGSNFQINPDDPNVRSQSAATPLVFQYLTQTQGSSTGVNTSDFIGSNYDNAGTITAIPGSSNQATIQRIYLYPTGTVRVQYGPIIYNTLNNALAAVSSESFTQNPSLTGNAILLGYVVLTKGATALNDATNARILQAVPVGGNLVTVTGMVNPMTTTGDMIKSLDNNGTPSRLAVGNTDQVLSVTSGLPAWKNKVDTIYRKAGQDSIFYKMAGIERAIKDSVGGSGTVTSVGIASTGLTVSGSPITSSGTITLDVAANAISNAKLRQSAGLSVIGRSANSTGNVADITAGTEWHTLRRDGSNVLGFGTLNAASFNPTFSAGQIAQTDGSGNVTWVANSSLSADSLSFRQVGGTALQGRVNTVSVLTNYSGNVGLSNAANAMDSANFLWGARAGQSLTSGIQNIAFGRASAKSATSSSNNVSIGDSSLTQWADATDGGVVAIGARALMNSQSVGVNQYPNTAIGFRALELVSTGFENAAFGHESGRTMTTASGNTLFGAFSAALATGSNNTAIGARSALNLSTGSNNTIVNSSVPTLTTGGSNTIIGAGTDVASAGTSNAVAIGLNARAGNTGTAIGLNARALGLSSVAIGAFASASMASGDYSTYVGTNSGGPSGTGARLVIIGGRASGQSITGSDNIAIGSEVQLLSLTEANQLMFGSNSTRWLTSDISGSHRRWTFNGTSATNITANTAGVTLDMTGTLGGFRRPQLTTTQRNALAAVSGNSVWNTTLLTNDVYDGTRWVQQPNGLSGSATLDFASTAAQTSADLTMTVTGAAVGDIVHVGIPAANANTCYTGWVSATNTVSVRFNNYSSAAVDPASGTFKVYVIKN